MFKIFDFDIPNYKEDDFFSIIRNKEDVLILFMNIVNFILAYKNTNQQNKTIGEIKIYMNKKREYIFSKMIIASIILYVFLFLYMKKKIVITK
ncbi:MAG: hypothetical protein SPI03_04925 [Campylobacter sputorum]|uniref:hypothetical protein n=1 Tax=Campylobacter sputorum TaxID=206 RepID=UPI000B773989|nr:hypothetical protein [Campylobacter sputorum]ASM38691.1 hypothetical protein CSPARA_1133 [Campylobacter sputorum bv. paraureolyticus LMG 11764]MDY6120658.1 hypothetical protein [Campylobacter sputorum]